MNRAALLIVSLSLLFGTACGDDVKLNPDGPLGVDPDAPDARPPAAPPRAVVVAGDFTAGNPGVMASINPRTREVTMNVAPQGAIGDDPMLRKVGLELFVINRTSNNVTILDAATFAFVEQLGTGAGSNPQDVAVVGEKLYLPAFGGKGVSVVTRGSAAITEIDLSADDPDGKPNCQSIYLVDTRLFVACGLLDDAQFLSPRGPGRVYVIDTTTDTRIATVTMATKNPLGLFERAPDAAMLGNDLVIPTVDFGASNAGCIERISTGATPAANGCVVTNAELGGFANRVDFQVLNPSSAARFESGPPPESAMLWLAVNGAFPNASLRGYDVSTSTLWPVLTPTTQVITDVIHCPGGELVIADQKMDAAGIRVHENTVETTTTPLNIGLPPKSAHGLVCY